MTQNIQPWTLESPQDPNLIQTHIQTLRNHHITEAPIEICYEVTSGYERKLPVTIVTLDEVKQEVRFSIKPEYELFCFFDSLPLTEFIQRMLAAPHTESQENNLADCSQTQASPILQLHYSEPSQDYKQEQAAQSLLADDSPTHQEKSTPYGSQSSISIKSSTGSSNASTLIRTSYSPFLPKTLDDKVDLLFIDQLRLLDAPQLTFTQFCIQQGYTQRMIMQETSFGYPSYYKKGINTDDSQITEAIALWTSTFPSHKEPFDDWFIRGTHIEQINTSVQNYSAIISAIADVLPIKSIPNAPDIPSKCIEKMKQVWSLTYSVTHNLRFETWLRETEQDNRLYSPFESTHSLGSFFNYNSSDISTHKDNLVQTLPILSHQASIRALKNSLDDKLLWHVDFQKYYIPPYPMIPHGFLEEFHLTDITQDSNSRFSVWKILRESFVTKIASEAKDDFERVKSHPLVNIYKRSRDRMSTNAQEIPIPYYVVKQHVHAHEYLRSLRSTGRMANFEFYDLFVRPIEFLFTIGMPLHELLTKSAFSYTARLELFREVLRISGFTPADVFQCTPNDLFKELCKIRHLHPADILPRVDHRAITVPVARAPSLQVFPCKIMQEISEVPIAEFADGGKLTGYEPHPYYPPPKSILDVFIPSSTDKFLPPTLFSEYTFHKKILKAYTDYQNSMNEWSPSQPAKYYQKRQFKAQQLFAKMSKYKNLPSPNTVTFHELTWIRTNTFDPPPWTTYDLSAHEITRVTRFESFSQDMKKLFISKPNEGQISLLSNGCSGILSIKKTSSTTYINNTLVLSNEQPIARESHIKIGPSSLRTLTKHCGIFLLKRLPPRHLDWKITNTDPLFNKVFTEDFATTTITCYLTTSMERMVSVLFTRQLKSSTCQARMHPILVPWIYFGSMHSILTRICSSLPPEPTPSSPEMD